MSFNSVDNILQNLMKQPELLPVNQWTELKSAWDRVVFAKYREHTRVLPSRNLSNTLYIVTSSSTLSHYLSLQEKLFLKKLNDILSQPIAKIRFSHTQWYTVETPPETIINESVNAVSIGADEICPKCQRKANQKELIRWGKCRFCQIKDWSQNSKY